MLFGAQAGMLQKVKRKSVARRAAPSDLRPHAERAAGLLRALANEQRLMILCQLLGGPRSVGELNAQVPLSQSALSQHLAVLREAGVVNAERAAQSILYSLPAGVVTKLIGVLEKEFCDP